MRPPPAFALAFAFAVAVGGCVSPEPSSPPANDTGSGSLLPAPGFPAVDSVAIGLDTPWDLAFSSDGRIFVTERPGRIRVVDATGTLLADPWATIDVAEVSESGLMGIALHPDFPETPSVYAYYTYGVSGETPLLNRLVRFTEQGGRGVRPETLLDGVPGAPIHDGGRIRFGPDGLLYVTAGDAANPANSQNDAVFAGKVLRVTPDGDAAPGNPTPGSPVFTKGHRNPQGLCFTPDGRLYSVEHGPDTDDELNLLVAGANYGWPLSRGEDGGPGFTPALKSWTPTIAPGGCAFYEGHLYFVTLKDRDLRRLTIDPADPETVTDEEVLFDNEYGRLRGIEAGPDGALYLTTSNKDGRGDPDEGDDRILRIRFS
ncbi:MAG: PQQ-dependent sugar dehydrogenase [Methanobacteriota archaeon]